MISRVEVAVIHTGNGGGAAELKIVGSGGRRWGIGDSEVVLGLELSSDARQACFIQMVEIVVVASDDSGLRLR